MRRETVEALINHLEERDMPPVRYRLWRAVKDEIEEDKRREADLIFKSEKINAERR